jgi:uncharacterized protein YukE
VSAFNAFLTTWSEARATYGAGPATEGAEFDQSPRLQQLQTATQSTAPQAAWTGSAADAYDATNTRHARTLGEFANLEQRLAAEIDRSAATVTAGRTALDDIRQRAVDAANLTPNTTAGEVMRWQIASKGAAEIAEVMNQTNGDLFSVAERLRSLGDEYQALGNPGEDQPLNFGPGDQDQQKLSASDVDLDDIVYKKPGELGPYGYTELVPNSGVWIPDPNGPMAPTEPPKYPVDLADVVQVGPNELAPYGYTELIPGSGMYVPDPAAPNFSPDGHVSNPLNSNDILYLPDGRLPPYGYDELYPGSDLYVPGPVGRSPGTTYPS